MGEDANLPLLEMIAYHVIKHPRGWAFRTHDGLRALKVFREKRKAVPHAKRTLKGKEADLFIHGKNGLVELRFRP